MASGRLGALHFPVLHDLVESAHDAHGGVGAVRRPLHAAVLAQDLHFNTLQYAGGHDGVWGVMQFTNSNQLAQITLTDRKRAPLLIHFLLCHFSCFHVSNAKNIFIEITLNWGIYCQLNTNIAKFHWFPHSTLCWHTLQQKIVSWTCGMKSHIHSQTSTAGLIISSHNLYWV